MTYDELKPHIESHGYKPALAPIEKVKSLQGDYEKLLTDQNLPRSQISAINTSITRLNAIPAKWPSMLILAVPRGLKLTDAKEHIKIIVEQTGYQAAVRPGLPLKRLAVQSGLAMYGRNNLTYISGIGSNYGLVAFVTKIPCTSHTWRESPATAPMCDTCDICIINCPTGAISKDRFIVDSSKCKVCSKCRNRCPMNKQGYELPHTDTIYRIPTT